MGSPRGRRSRRDLLKLAAAAAFSVAGAGYLAAARLLRNDTGSPTSGEASQETTSTAAASTGADRPEEPTSPATSAEAEPSTTSTVTATVAARVVLCRDAWHAAPPNRTLPEHRIERLTVHHTAALLSDNREAPGRVRNFQAYHQRQGFADLAYHYVIDARGNVYEARTVTVPGETFTEYDPTGHFLVVLDGHFDQQEVPEAQFEALVEVLAWAAGRFGVPPETIAGHRDYAATSCPGASLYPPVADGTLRRRVEQRLASGGVELSRLCGEEGQARIAAIEAGTA